MGAKIRRYCAIADETTVVPIRPELANLRWLPGGTQGRYVDGRGVARLPPRERSIMPTWTNPLCSQNARVASYGW